MQLDAVGAFSSCMRVCFLHRWFEDVRRCLKGHEEVPSDNRSKSTREHKRHIDQGSGMQRGLNKKPQRTEARNRSKMVNEEVWNYSKLKGSMS